MCNCAQASIYFHLICANDNDNDIFQGLTIIIIIIITIIIILIIIFLAYLHVQFISIKKDTILQAKQSYFQAQFFLKEKKQMSQSYNNIPICNKKIMSQSHSD